MTAAGMTVHTSRSASLALDRRDEADISEGDDCMIEEGLGEGQEEAFYERQVHSPDVIGPSFMQRTPSLFLSRPPSFAASHSPSNLAPSEYNKFDLDKRHTSTAHASRPSQIFCISLLALTLLCLVLILSTSMICARPTSGTVSTKLDLTVNLGYAQYTGISSPSDNETIMWLGIRYAAPPLGDLRWKAPKAPLTNSTVQMADTYGDICLPTPSTGIAAGFSEDCLFLNVYAPRNISKNHPVYLFIQGGGMNELANPNMNGTSLVKSADHDMIVIEFNYRVGPWGFLASKEVQAGGDLNVGLLDQRFVLQWVQQHIHLFGGDPKRVTLGGASAGAASVVLHLSAYGGRNDQLFSQAAAESSSFGSQFTVAESQYQYDALVARVGCNTTSDSLQCLRNLDSLVLATNNTVIPTPGAGGGKPVFMYSDVIDGSFVQDYTYKLFATGRFIKVPTIFGAVTNDGTIFTQPQNISSYDVMNAFLKNNFPKLTTAELARIDQLYPESGTFPDAGPYWRTAANAYGDMRYMCPAIWLSTVYDEHRAQGYLYHWDVASESNIESGYGSTHCDEMNSIWGVAAEEPEVSLNPIIQAYWTSFVRAGNPNTYKLANAPTWEKCNSTGLQRIHFVNDTSQIAMENVTADIYSRCNVLTTMGGPLGQ